MTTLDFTVFDLDLPAGSKNKTAPLVTGEKEALLVDAAFTRADGHRLVAAVLDSGKELTTVFVSHADPDFSFGAEAVADAFPQARFVATPIVIDHITASYEGKHEAWEAPGPNLPTRLADLPDTAADAFAITVTRDCLAVFEEELGKAPDDATLTEALVARYPDHGMADRRPARREGGQGRDELGLTTMATTADTDFATSTAPADVVRRQYLASAVGDLNALRATLCPRRGVDRDGRLPVGRDLPHPRRRHLPRDGTARRGVGRLDRPRRHLRRRR